MLAEEVREHLQTELIPFWQGMKDEKNGGFYGYLGYDLKIDQEAVKGCILNSRILWFFSNAYLLLKEEELLESARHAFLFLKDRFLDRKYGGVYWSLTCEGKPGRGTEDGKGEHIWDVFVREPGHVYGGHSGETASTTITDSARMSG